MRILYIPKKKTTIIQGDYLELTWENINVVPIADKSLVSSWNTFFDLPNYGTPFTDVVIQGNVVKLYGATNISLKRDLFCRKAYRSVELLKIRDYAHCIYTVEMEAFSVNTTSKLQDVILPVTHTVSQLAFKDNSTLTYVSIPEVVEIGQFGFYGCYNVNQFIFDKLIDAGDYAFYRTDGVETYRFPLLETAGDYCFASLYGDRCKTIDLPNCLSIGDNCFKGQAYCSLIKLPKVTSLGSTISDGGRVNLFDDPLHITVDGYTPQYPIIYNGDNGVFYYLGSRTQLTLHINSTILTQDGGYPDNDICRLLQAGELYNINEFIEHYGNNVTIIPV